MHAADVVKIIFMASTSNHVHFAPGLHIPNGTRNIGFYKCFGAIENFWIRNKDNSIHVAELEFDGAVFNIHETMHWCS